MARAKKAPEPPKRGPGRPAIPGLRATIFRIDEPAMSGLLEYASGYDVGRSKAVRELLTAYDQSAAVRAAVAAWRSGRAGR